MISLFLSLLITFIFPIDLFDNYNLVLKNDSPFVNRSQVLNFNFSEYHHSLGRAEDTLVLDDGTEFIYPGFIYSAQKFTPGVQCTLKSILFKLGMSGMPCSLFVWNDSLGIPQSSINLISPIFFMSSAPDWQRIDLPTPVIIDDDFWIGLYHTTSVYSDNTPNFYNRFAESNDKVIWFVYNYHTYGELLIRSIVTLTGPRHDVSCSNIFSKRGFFLPNPAYDTVGVVVKNLGNVTEIDVPVYLRVTDSLGLLVFFDFVYIDSLKHNEIDTAFVPWNFNENGDYIIEGYPWLSNDCIRDNDRLEIESYIRTYPSELYYDIIDTILFSTLLDSIANKFFPPYYPCKIESIKCFYIAPPAESIYTYGIAVVILDDDSLGGFPGTEMAKDSVLGLVGPNWFQWLTVDFSHHNVVFDSGAFFVEWTYISDSTTLENPQLWTDWGNPPYAMMVWFQEDGIWYHSNEHFDAILRACVNYPSAVAENKKQAVLNNSLLVNPSITKGRFKCSFSILKDGRIEIALYSIDGRKVRNLLTTFVKKGLHYFYPDISDLPHGVYFIQLKSESFIKNKKLILIK